MKNGFKIAIEVLGNWCPQIIQNFAAVFHRYIRSPALGNVILFPANTVSEAEDIDGRESISEILDNHLVLQLEI